MRRPGWIEPHAGEDRSAVVEGAAGWRRWARGWGGEKAGRAAGGGGKLQCPPASNLTLSCSSSASFLTSSAYCFSASGNGSGRQLVRQDSKGSGNSPRSQPTRGLQVGCVLVKNPMQLLCGIHRSRGALEGASQKALEAELRGHVQKEQEQVGFSTLQQLTAVPLRVFLGMVCSIIEGSTQIGEGCTRKWARVDWSNARWLGPMIDNPPKGSRLPANCRANHT